MVDAIRRDRAEVIEAGRPFRPLLAVLALAPGLGARLAARAGATDLFRRVAAERDRI